MKNVSPKLWERYPNLQVLDLSQNPVEIPDAFANLEGLKNLRLQQCGLSSLPISLLSGLKNLQSLDLDKNNFSEFYSDSISCDQVDLKSLSYLNLNGNNIKEIPAFLRFLPNLKQLLMHMNKVTSVKPLCRSMLSGLEVLDLGGNKVDDLPVALIHYCKGLCQLTLTNNEL